RVERTIENYDAENAATLSEERQESTGDVNENGAGGATNERTVTNYQVPRTVEKYVPEVGNIERLSASVLVDGVYDEATGEDGTVTRTYRERTPQELEKFRTLVAAAIGFDRTRSDELTVISFPFAQDEEPQTTSPNALPWMKIIEKALLGLALVGLFLLARTLMMRLLKGVPALPAAATTGALPEGAAHYTLTSGSMPRTPAELAARTEGEAAALHEGPQVTREGGGPHVIFKQTPQTIVVEEEAPSIEVLKHQELLKRTTDYMVEKPDQATQILRGWILDESPEKLPR
ncbi:MAG: flagellar M-ring protein FliF C-terminal domain-containing protein, partial [bacterium]|nr:flagellar M-ring protein FliF C-terminal domain-containing protein [bacterium]